MNDAIKGWPDVMPLRQTKKSKVPRSFFVSFRFDFFLFSIHLRKEIIAEKKKNILKHNLSTGSTLNLFTKL